MMNEIRDENKVACCLFSEMVLHLLFMKEEEAFPILLESYI